MIDCIDEPSQRRLTKDRLEQLPGMQAAVQQAARRPRLRKLFAVFPPLFFIYALPTLMSNAGLIPRQTPLYPALVQNLLPAARRPGPGFLRAQMPTSVPNTDPPADSKGRPGRLSGLSWMREALQLLWLALV